MADFPVAFAVPRAPEHGGEHVLLADEEGGDADEVVAELGERGGFVGFVLGQDFQGEEVGDCSPALGPSAGVDLRGALVEEDDGFVVEVEAVAVGRAREGELVPEAAGDADVGQRRQGVDALADGLAFGGQAAKGAFDRNVVIEAPFVGEDPRDAGGGGGVDEFGLGIWGGHDAHCDDEDFLAF